MQPTEAALLHEQGNDHKRYWDRSKYDHRNTKTEVGAHGAVPSCCQAGARHSQSPITAEDGAVMASIKCIPASWGLSKIAHSQRQLRAAFIFCLEQN
jgi:uncharacterized Rossmann fold enzyme